MMENYEIIAQLSDLSGLRTDTLRIDEAYINLFTDPEAHMIPLSPFVSDLIMRRTVDAAAIFERDITMLGITHTNEDDPHINFLDGCDETIFNTDESVCVISEDMLGLVEDGTLRMSATYPVVEYETIRLEIIGHIMAFDDNFREINKLVYSTYHNPELLDGFFHYDIQPRNYWWMDEETLRIQTEELFHRLETDPTVCVASSDMFIWPNIPPVRLQLAKPTGEYYTVEADLRVVGTVSESGTIIAPFRAVNQIAEEFLRLPPQANALSAVVIGNENLLRFKGSAWMHFSRVRPVFDSRPFAMTIYDTEYYDIAIPLMQNIIFVNAAVPFIYVISVCVGFVASFLIIRRRKQEFAIMRSVGFNRFKIFFGALSEQAILAVLGAGLGALLVMLSWGYLSLTEPAIFLGCYMVGAAVSSVRAAGTDVLKILSEKE
jgi:hypothetical protein